MEIFLGSHHFLLIMKHTPPPLVLPASAVLPIRKKEKLSDGVTAVSGTVGVSHVLVKQRMLQSLMSHWKLIPTKTAFFHIRNIAKLRNMLSVSVSLFVSAMGLTSSGN